MPDPVAAAAPAPAAAPAASKSSAAPVKPTPAGAPASAGGKTAAPAAKAETTAPPSRHQWTSTIDGREEKFEATDEELRDAYRMRSASNRRFEESAKAKKEAAELVRRSEGMLKRVNDPKEFFRAFREANPDTDDVQVLAEALEVRLREEEELRDPNIRERRRLESENAGFKTKEAERAAEAERQQNEQVVHTELERLSQTFKEAIGLTKVPINDITIKLMAEAERTNRQRGWGLTPSQLAQATEKATTELISGLLSPNDDIDPATKLPNADLAATAESDKRLLSSFPDLSKRIHRALVREHKRKTSGQAAQPNAVAPRARVPIPDPGAPKLKVMSSAEEHKAYGLAGKSLRSL